MLTITQNIDALHLAGGTRHLIHMHGELSRARRRLRGACAASTMWTGDLDRN